MSITSGYLNAVGAVVRRDMRIFLTYRLRWLTRIVGTLLTLTTFYYVSKLARSVLRHVRVTSKQELKDRIMAAIDDVNRHPVVHTWSYRLEDAA